MGMKTKSTFLRSISALLICSFLSFPVAQTAQAEMVSTETFLAHSTQTTPRDRLMVLLEKKEVLQKLEEYGVSPNEARERLASLSDAEVAKLNAQIDQLPAGADAAGAILGTAFAVFLILLITDLLCLTKVFKFTRCAGSN
jgi:uncharacterized small protein (DUF1192 family)